MQQKSNSTERLSGKRLRIVAVALFIFFLFSILIVQYYKIQILESEKWLSIANSQHHFSTHEPFRRGKILSNTSVQYGHPEKKEPFVLDVLKYHVYIDPLVIPEGKKEEIALYLKKSLELEEDILPHFYKKSRSRRVISWISAAEQQKIMDWWKPFARRSKIASNAVYFLKDYQRSYPFGAMLGQVIHAVRQERDVGCQKAIPTGGIELVMDKYLQGEIGQTVLMRSPKYNLDSDRMSKPAAPGNDVELTINHCLQAITEEELARGSEKVHAKGAIAVMMDPVTGEILAMAHYPSFDPAKYSHYYNDPAKLDLTRPKAITDCIEPGSTMKPITIAIALKANRVLIERGERPIFNPGDMLRCDISQLPGRTRPLRDVRLHKYLNMYHAIQKSSNVYPARLVQKIVETLGPKWYHDQLVEIFGFGRKTAVELPYENPGMVPKPGKKYANGALQWSAPTPYSLAMGYNLLANAVQMARAYAVIANGGYLVEPFLVRRVLAPDGKVLEDYCNKRAVEKVLEADIAEEVVRAMKYSTKFGGSAQLADVPGYTEAGKTSTSEKLIGGVYSKTKHMSSFIGFAPAIDPRFVIVIVLDEPEKRYIEGFGTTHYGGKCAAPIFREIAKRSLQYLGVAPDDPYGYPRGDPRANPEKADWSRELRELGEIYKKWNEG